MTKATSVSVPGSPRRRSELGWKVPCWPWAEIRLGITASCSFSWSRCEEARAWIPSPRGPGSSACHVARVRGLSGMCPQAAGAPDERRVQGWTSQSSGEAAWAQQSLPNVGKAPCSEFRRDFYGNQTCSLWAKVMPPRVRNAHNHDVERKTVCGSREGKPQSGEKGILECTVISYYVLIT